MAVSSNRTMEYENPLCFELQRKFQNRGVNAPAVSNKTQSSVMKHITDGLNPYERETTKRESSSHNEMHSSVRMNSMNRVSQNGEGVLSRPVTAPIARPVARPQSGERVRTSAEPQKAQGNPQQLDGRLQYQLASGTYAHSRMYEEKYNRGFVFPEQRLNSMVQIGYGEAFRSAARVRDCARRCEAEVQRAQRIRRRKGILSVPVLGESFEILGDWGNLVKRTFVRRAEIMTGTRSLHREKTIRNKKKASIVAIALGVVFAVLLMMIIYSFAQVSEIKSELSDLNETRETLIEKQSELSLDLEKRDDIRVIQEIALSQLGMVSADKVESRYVSVVSGDQISLDS